MPSPLFCVPWPLVRARKDHLPYHPFMRSKSKRFLAFVSFQLFFLAALHAQNCIPTNINGSVIEMACPATCTNLVFKIPHIKGSSDYTVVEKSYEPFPYSAPGGVELSMLYVDDVFSPLIPLPFTFCFFGSNYNSLVVGSNGLVSFDVSNAGFEHAWSLTTTPHGAIPQPLPYAGGVPDDLDVTYYPKASIMGAYHDLFPTLTASSTRRIEYSVVGTAPCRKFVTSFYHVPMYSSSCNLLWATEQIVLHESTGIIDVNIGNKPLCTGWNEGLAILGIQNWNRDKAVTAPGKNCTAWSASDTSFRFVPSGAGSRYVISELLTMGGALVATADTITTTTGLLDLRFQNICPPPGTTEYVVRTRFSACDNAVTQLISLDTITVNRTNELHSTGATTNTECGPPNGTITITTPPGYGIAPFNYVLDGGTPVTGGNPYTFTGVAHGTHTVVVTDASGSCTSTIDLTVTRNNSLTATTSATPTACAAVATGTITVMATNGTGPWLYKLDGFAAVPGPNPYTFTNVNSGNHDIVVYDATGCQTNIIVVNVAAGAGVNGNAISSAASCTAIANGSITTTATSGIAPYTWQLDGAPAVNGTSPFTFNNVSSGPHTVTIRDAVGCTRDVTINVVAGPGVNGTATTTPASCQGVNNGSVTVAATSGTAPFTWRLDGGPAQNGPSPYTFNGLSTGFHSVVITDNVGCTRTLDVNVGAGPVLIANASSTATNCNGASNGTITVIPANGTGPFTFSLDGAPFVTGTAPYTFNNVTAGSHTVLVRDAPGCITNPILVNVAAGPVITTTVNRTHVLCNGAATGAITILQPSLGAAPFQYSLDGVNWQGGNSFTGLTAGTYTAYYRSANGCQGSQVVNITEPTALTATTSMIPVVCNGQNNGTIAITPGGGVGPYSYSLDGISWQASNVYSIPAGNYTVRIRDANGCIITRSLAVTEPSVLTASSVNTNASCDGGDDGRITVSPSGGNGSYRYSIDGTNFQASNVFLVAPGNYAIVVKDILGCTTTFTTTVGLSVNLFLTPHPDATICDGESAQLNAASNANIYNWTPAVTLNDANIATPVASPRTTTEYYLTAKLGRCTAYDTLIVHVNAAPVPDAGPDGDICYGQAYTLQGAGGTQFSWTPAIYLDNPSVRDPVATPSKTTTYSLSVIDALGCRSLITDEVKVLVSKPIRVITIPYDTIVHPGARFPLLALSGGITYTWSPPFGLSDPNVANPTVTVGDIGDEISYKVVATTTEGCKGEGYVRIRVYKGPDIYVPTAFTPNNDGKNDQFIPFPVGIKSYNYFRVFNRWGQLLFSTTRLNEGWDGRMGGKEQATGVYIWQVEGQTLDGKIINKKGTVTLIR
jgi:gliding motility-associated-like protein